MALDDTARRRWIGAGVLAAALLMLLAGQTMLQERLRGGGFFAYWLVCLGFTGVAIAVAFLDVRATRTEIRKQERELIEQTIRQIQEDAGARRSKIQGKS